MKKQAYSPKAIAEAGIMFVLITLIIIMTTSIPVLSFVGMFILPIPIILLYIRYDFKLAIASTVMSIVLTSFLYGVITAVASGVAYGLTGCTLGYCIKNNKKSGVTLNYVSISIFIGNIITYLIYALFIGKAGLVNTLNESVNMIKKYYIDIRNVYINQSAYEEIVNKINEIIQIINIKNVLIILPILLIVMSFIQGYINYIITYKILKKLRYNMNRFISPSEIYVSNRIVAYTIIITCIGIILSGNNIPFANYINKVFEIIAMMLILIDGIAACIYFLRKKYKKSRKFTLIILCIGVIMPVFQEVYFMVGILDIILNLRKLDPDPIRKIKSRE